MGGCERGWKDSVMNICNNQNRLDTLQDDANDNNDYFH